MKDNINIVNLIKECRIFSSLDLEICEAIAPLFEPAELREKKSSAVKNSEKENELNAILDKMNRVGYDNLSENEKAFLKSASQE